MADLGRLLVVFGLAIALVGVVLVSGVQLPWLGRLPGDVVIQRDRFTFYFPIATSIVLSVVLTILFRLFGR
jgi:hypothetical protein